MAKFRKKLVTLFPSCKLNKNSFDSVTAIHPSTFCQLDIINIIETCLISEMFRPNSLDLISFVSFRRVTTFDIRRSFQWWHIY